MTGLAALLAGLGILTGAAVLAVTRLTRPSLGIALDFFTAAGLLHLISADTWLAIGTVAAVVLVRLLLRAGFVASAHASAVHGYRNEG